MFFHIFNPINELYHFKANKMILLIHYDKKHGNVKINGQDYHSGDHNYERLKKIIG